MLKPIVEDLTYKTIKSCFLIRNFLSVDKCYELGQLEKEVKFTNADDKYPKSYRTNQRYWQDDFELAKYLSNQLFIRKTDSASFSYVLKGFCGLNERFRYCKYSEGETFSNHRDGHFFRGNDTESKMTFLLYLNDSYLGGETKFYSDKGKTELLFSHQGKTGDVLIFDHDIWHEGCSVSSGVKYMLRSDLLFLQNSKYDSHLGYVWSMTTANNKLFTTGRDQSIKSWEKGEQLLNEVRYHKASVLKVISDEKYVYSTGRDGLLCKADLELNLLIKRETGHVTGLDIEVLNDNLVSIGSDGYLRLWDENLNLKYERKGHIGWGWCIQKLNDNLFVSAGEDGYCRFWNSELNSIHEIDLGLGCVRCIDYSEGYLYLGTESGLVVKINAVSKSLVTSKRVHSGIVRDIKVFDKEIFSTGEDCRVCSSSLDLLEGETAYVGKDFVTCIEKIGENTLVSGYEGKVIKLIREEAAV